jgi:hypothetical protein
MSDERFCQIVDFEYIGLLDRKVKIGQTAIVTASDKPVSDIQVANHLGKTLPEFELPPTMNSRVCYIGAIADQAKKSS